MPVLHSPSQRHSTTGAELLLIRTRTELLCASRGSPSSFPLLMRSSQVIESEVEIQRDIWALSPAPLLKAGSARAGGSGTSPDDFGMSPRMGTLPPVWADCQGSVSLTLKCFLMFRTKLLSFSLWPLPLVFSLGTTDRNLALVLLPFGYFYTLMAFPQTFSSQTRQPQHCARSCSHQHSPSVLP